MKPLALAAVEQRIQFCHGRSTIAEADLAAYFGLTAAGLAAALRPHEPLPGEFAFIPLAELPIPRGRSAPGRVFTEHGVLAIAYIVGSADAIARGLQLLRVFLRLRGADSAMPGFRVSEPRDSSRLDSKAGWSTGDSAEDSRRELAELPR